MEALFKRYFWIVKALGVAAAAGLAASAVSTQLGSWYLLESSDAEAEEGGADTEGDDEEDDDLLDADNPFKPKALGAAPRNTSRGKDRAAEQLRKYNLFCPTCVPVVAEGEAPPPGAVDAEGRPLGPVLSPGEVRSGLPLRLQATMEAEDPEYSLATVYDTENFAVGIYAEGDVIRPGVVVTGVDKGLLHLRNNAKLEYIELGGEVPPPKAPEAKAEDDKKDDAPAKPSESAIPGAEDAINCPSENLCVVERAFVEQLMANPAALAKQARIVPAKDGEVGFKFYGIRRGSLPKLLGLKNGDKLVAVNGEELSGIDQAMSLYTKLRRASNLSISIERKGKSINKEIQIQ